MDLAAIGSIYLVAVAGLVVAAALAAAALAAAGLAAVAADYSAGFAAVEAGR